MKKIISIFIISAVIVSLCGCGTISSLIKKGLSPKSETASSESTEDNFWNAGNVEITDEVSDIEIDWASGEVNVQYGNVTFITLEEKSSVELQDSERMRWRVDGTTLKIKMLPTSIINFSLGGKILTVTLPDGYHLDSLDVSVASAVSTVSVHADELEIDSASGDVSLLTSGTVRKSEINTASGNVTLYLPADASFEMEVDTASGELYSEIALKKQEDKYIAGNGSNELSISTSSGDINLLEYKRN